MVLAAHDRVDQWNRRAECSCATEAGASSVPWVSVSERISGMAFMEVDPAFAKMAFMPLSLPRM